MHEHGTTFLLLLYFFFSHLFLLNFIPLSLRERGIYETRLRIGVVFSVRPYSIFLNLRSFSLVVSAMI